MTFCTNLSYPVKCHKKFIPAPLALLQRETHGLDMSRMKSNLIGHRMAHSQSLFKRDLLGHYGCVNAIEFSNDGDLIASGGDDRRLLLWNISRVMYDGKAPDVIDTTHVNNINSCCFDLTNRKIATGGNDGLVIMHDFCSKKSTCIYLSDAIYCLSPDPINSTIIAAAGHNGKVQIIDTRLPADSSHFILADCDDSAMHSVMYNPVDPRLLATANSGHGVALWDIRMPLKSLNYKNSVNNCMSVRFNCLGDKLIALRRRASPILFDVAKAQPIHEFDYSTYYNACTLKSCCFAGLKDEYVVSGSDDFCIYLWKIPTDPDEPYHQNEPHMILKGHRSIVNQVRYCPINQLLISSGVEKLIKMWTPYSIPGCTGKLVHSRRYGDDDEVERNAYSHEEYIHMVLQAGSFLSHDYENGNTEEEPCMIAFFDSLIQREVEQCVEEDVKEDCSSSENECTGNDGIQWNRDFDENENDVEGTARDRPLVDPANVTPQSQEIDRRSSLDTGGSPSSRAEESSRPFFRDLGSSSSSDESESEEVDQILRAMYSRYMTSREQAVNETLQPSGSKISTVIAKGKQQESSKKTHTRKLQRIREDLQHSGDQFLRDNATNMSILADIIDNFVDNLVSIEPNNTNTLSDTNDGHMSTDSANVSRTQQSVAETGELVENNDVLNSRCRTRTTLTSPFNDSSDLPVVDSSRPGPSFSAATPNLAEQDKSNGQRNLFRTAQQSLVNGKCNHSGIHNKHSKSHKRLQSTNESSRLDCDSDSMSNEQNGFIKAGDVHAPDNASRDWSNVIDKNISPQASDGPICEVTCASAPFHNIGLKCSDTNTALQTLTRLGGDNGDTSQAVDSTICTDDFISSKKIEKENVIEKELPSNSQHGTLRDSSPSSSSSSLSPTSSVSINYSASSSSLSSSLSCGEVVKDRVTVSDDKTVCSRAGDFSIVKLSAVIDPTENPITSQTVHFKKASRAKKRHFRTANNDSPSSDDEEQR